MINTQNYLTILHITLYNCCLHVEECNLTSFARKSGGVGPAYLFGDVGGRIEDQLFLGSTDWDMTKTRFLYSIGFRQHFPNNFGLKGTLAYGQFAGTDEGTSNPTRGYSFTSDITEISLQSEYIVRRTLRPSPHPKSCVYFCRSRYTQLSTNTYQRWWTTPYRHCKRPGHHPGNAFWHWLSV